MKLFSRGREDASDNGSNGADPGATPGEAGSPQVAPTPEEVSNAPDPNEIQAALDSSVKEISDKIARLSAGLDTVNQERESFEEKVERMESRMRKLASLTEMISAQYNPFLGDEPHERAKLQADHETPKESPAPPAETETPVAADPVTNENEEDDEMAARLGNGHSAHPNAGAPQRLPVLHETNAAPLGGTHLNAVEPDFNNSLLILKWVEMLLKASRSREGFRELLGYYQGIGWIGEPVREQLIAYADGLALSELDEGEAKPDWRANVELHERTLVFIKKLKGQHGGPS